MNDCKLLTDEKVYTTNAVEEHSVTPAPYWGQDVSAAIIFIIYTGYILLLGLF